MRGLCVTSRPLRGFIDPTPNDSPRNRAAIALCEQCPLRQQCAEDALEAGFTLKPGFAGPAQGVIQAGVVCRGDLTTAFELAIIAGVPVPDYQSLEERRRADAPAECVNCETKLWPWTRTPEDIPEGYNQHFARGYCTQCRTAYRKAMRSIPRAEVGLRKQIDRKRHHIVAKRVTTPPPEQMELFSEC